MLLEKGIAFLVVGALLSIVIVLGVKQAFRFAKGSTTYTESSEHRDFLRFPYISFCPDFKRSQLPDSKIWILPLLNIPDAEKLEENFPNSEKSLQALWDRTTFKLEEILKELHFYETDIGFSSYNLSSGSWLTSNCIKIEEFDMLSGRCFVINLPCSENHQVISFTMQFNLSDTFRDSMTINFHDNVESAYLGLNAAFWTHPITWEKLNHGDRKESELEKRVRTKHQGVSMEAYNDCIRDMLHRHLPKSKQEVLCRAPPFTTILAYASVNTSAIPLCTDIQTFTNTYSIMFELLMLPHSSVVCRKQLKTLVNYVHRTREYAVPMEPPDTTLTSLGVYFGSTDIIVSEEFIILDFGTLLSNIGGAIGMFLGWSIIDLAKGAQKIFKKTLGN